jgi:hypothetical protein
MIKSIRSLNKGTTIGSIIGLVLSIPFAIYIGIVFGGNLGGSFGWQLAETPGVLAREKSLPVRLSKRSFTESPYKEYLGLPIWETEPL